MILGIRTDKPLTELYLLDATGLTQDQYVWEAGRQLSVEILIKIQELLNRRKLKFKDVTGVVVYQGPGSFTGLRIGITVANAIAYGNRIPIAGAQDESWLIEAYSQLSQADSTPVIPVYGSDPHITQARK